METQGPAGRLRKKLRGPSFRQTKTTWHGTRGKTFNKTRGGKNNQSHQGKQKGLNRKWTLSNREAAARRTQASGSPEKQVLPQTQPWSAWWCQIFLSGLMSSGSQNMAYINGGGHKQWTTRNPSKIIFSDSTSECPSAWSQPNVIHLKSSCAGATQFPVPVHPKADLSVQKGSESINQIKNVFTSPENSSQTEQKCCSSTVYLRFKKMQISLKDKRPQTGSALMDQSAPRTLNR